MTVAALGTAASAAVLGITSAYGGGHSAHDAAATTSVVAQAPAAVAPAAPDAVADGHAASGAQDPAAMSGMGGMAGTESDGVSLYAVQTGALGVVVTDGSGRVVYGSDGDATNPPTSRCTGSCAQEWEPVVVPRGQQPELLGVKADTVGEIDRGDGSTQLTLGGWPAYVNRNDDGELQPAAAAHGSWFLLTPQGQKVPLG